MGGHIADVGEAIYAAAVGFAIGGFEDERYLQALTDAHDLLGGVYHCGFIFYYAWACEEEEVIGVVGL